jgi:hypothetical protein
LGWNKKEKRSKNWCIQFFEIWIECCCRLLLLLATRWETN